MVAGALRSRCAAPTAARVGAVIGAGVAVQLALAFLYVGAEFDIESLRRADRALDSSGLDFYADPAVRGRWPYPPLFLAWVQLAAGVGAATGLPFHGVVQLAPIAATAALAALVAARVEPRHRLAAAALLALGPVPVLVSGYHGQLDAVAMLAAACALLRWERPTGRRALEAGLLIGVGAAVKSVPLLMILALAPSARSWGERLRLAGAAAAVPLAALAPFLAAAPSATLEALTYGGVPGLGGISLLVQPAIARAHLLAAPRFEPSELTLFLAEHGEWIVAVPLLVAGALLLARRVPPRPAAVVVWLVALAFGINYAPQYATWPLAFLLLAGRPGWCLALQLAAAAPAVLFYLGPWDDERVASAYAVLAVGLLATVVLALAAALRTVRRGQPS